MAEQGILIERHPNLEPVAELLGSLDAFVRDVARSNCASLELLD